MSWLLRMMVVAIFSAAVMPAFAQTPEESFPHWAEKFKRHAAREGISQSLLDSAFEGLEPDEVVVKLDRKQPEGQITLEKYLSNTVNSRRITTGRELMQEHSSLLRDISGTYGVQPHFIVALWGIESNFGALQGNFSVVRSLATLAYEGRRREFFSKELIAALKIIQAEGMEPSELTGSWAGAMGNCQFMPSTYLKFAVDADNDGHRDIWNNNADALASIANYLRSLSWQDDRGWGVTATFPEHFKESDADIKRPHLAREWKKRGIEWTDESQFTNDMPVYAIYTDKANTASYLVTDNFKAILQWNRSRYFATAVGTLSDQLRD